MNLKIKLKAINSRHISPNYNYALSAAIYKLLRFGSKEFALFLHEKGYKSNGRTYKLFTYSLRFEKIRFSNGIIELLSPNVYLNISSPLVEEFVKNFVIGILQEQQFEIYAEYTKTLFSIEQAELIPEADIYSEMKFKMLSPMVVSTYKLFNGKKSQYYFRYDDNINEINRVFNQNLFNKFKLIHNKDYNGEPVKLRWDDNYIKNQKTKGRRISKKISITKDLNDIIDIIAIQTPFTIKGEPELIKVGYQCGFGEKNSMGFGMAEVVK